MYYGKVPVGPVAAGGVGAAVAGGIGGITWMIVAGATLIVAGLAVASLLPKLRGR
jgi:hypothetical protein